MIKAILKKNEIIRFLMWSYEKYKRDTIDWRPLFKQCGSNVTIRQGTTFHFPVRVVIMDNVGIQTNGYLNARGGLTIGANSRISRHITVYTYNHDFRKSSRIPYSAEALEFKTVILKRMSG